MVVYKILYRIDKDMLAFPTYKNSISPVIMHLYSLYSPEWYTCLIITHVCIITHVTETLTQQMKRIKQWCFSSV